MLFASQVGSEVCRFWDILVGKMHLAAHNSSHIVNKNVAKLMIFENFSNLFRFRCRMSCYVSLQLGRLPVNRLIGPEGKTGPETAGPVNCAVIQDLHIMAPAHKLRYIIIVLPQIFT